MPAPLTLKQHITTVGGIVLTLQNIITTANLDCRLNLKTIALHTGNAEYNPKVCVFWLGARTVPTFIHPISVLPLSS